MGEGNLIISRNMGNYSLETYTAVTIVYWVLAFFLSFVSLVTENELNTEKG